MQTFVNENALLYRCQEKLLLQFKLLFTVNVSIKTVVILGMIASQLFL